MKKIAVFAAGRGSNFEQICKAQKNGYFKAQIALLIASKPGIGAIETARRFEVPFVVFQNADYSSKEACNKALLSLLEKNEIDIVALAGWLRLIDSSVIEKYQNKILNIHPALLPFFGGKGMFGERVHHAVWESGMLVSGATIHIVDPEYDHGRIILQKSVQLDYTDSPLTIAQKVLKIEHEIYPQALKLLIEDRIDLSSDRIKIRKV